jgi:hypothetical protein
MRTDDNCCCYNNGHKHWLHYLLFEFVLQKRKNIFVLEDCCGEDNTSSLCLFDFLGIAPEDMLD